MKYIVTVRGKKFSWNFVVDLNPDDLKYLPEWREDGIEINQSIYTIPKWISDLGLRNIYAKLIDWGVIE